MMAVDPKCSFSIAKVLMEQYQQLHELYRLQELYFVRYVGPNIVPLIRLNLADLMGSCTDCKNREGCK